MRIQCFLLILFSLLASAIEIDGILNEPEWKDAPTYDGFTLKAVEAVNGNTLGATTDFKILLTKDAIYFGIRCHEPNMKKLLATASGKHMLCQEFRNYLLNK